MLDISNAGSTNGVGGRQWPHSCRPAFPQHACRNLSAWKRSIVRENRPRSQGVNTGWRYPSSNLLGISTGG
jgi:hypothetical protein